MSNGITATIAAACLVCLIFLYRDLVTAIPIAALLNAVFEYRLPRSMPLMGGWLLVGQPSFNSMIAVWEGVVLGHGFQLLRKKLAQRYWSRMEKNLRDLEEGALSLERLKNEDVESSSPSGYGDHILRIKLKKDQIRRNLNAYMNLVDGLPRLYAEHVSFSLGQRLFRTLWNREEAQRERRLHSDT